MKREIIWSNEMDGVEVVCVKGIEGFHCLTEGKSYRVYGAGDGCFLMDDHGKSLHPTSGIARYFKIPEVKTQTFSGLEWSPSSNEQAESRTKRMKMITELDESMVGSHIICATGSAFEYFTEGKAYEVRLIGGSCCIVDDRLGAPIFNRLDGCEFRMPYPGELEEPVDMTGLVPLEQWKPEYEDAKMVYMGDEIEHGLIRGKRYPLGQELDPKMCHAVDDANHRTWHGPIGCFMLPADYEHMDVYSHELRAARDNFDKWRINHSDYSSGPPVAAPRAMPPLPDGTRVTSGEKPMVFYEGVLVPFPQVTHSAVMKFPNGDIVEIPGPGEGWTKEVVHDEWSELPPSEKRPSVFNYEEGCMDVSFPSFTVGDPPEHGGFVIAHDMGKNVAHEYEARIDDAEPDLISLTKWTKMAVETKEERNTSYSDWKARFPLLHGLE